MSSILPFRFPASIQWIKIHPVHGESVITTSKTLVLQNIKITDAGFYTCKAQTTTSKMQGSLELRVKSMPLILTFIIGNRFETPYI